MKKIGLILMLCFAITAQAQKVLIEDANVEVRELTGSFDRIKVSGGIQLYLSQDEETKVAVSSSEADVVAGIKTRLDGTTLHIYFDGDKKWYKRNRTMRVYVSFRDLTRVEGSGATEIRFESEVKLPQLDIHISGASDLFGTLNVEDLSLHMSGASDARLKGRAAKLSLDCSGASDFKGYELRSVNCNVQASGASDLQLFVDQELSASASGASSIHYKGGGVVKNIHTSGASEIARKD
jgi:hypothetical protein